jgi:regulator of nonsense transcripts 3
MATSSQGGKQTNGVISIMAPATAGNPPKASVNKPATPKLKVIVRRLAPGLKEEEFKTCIGDEWKVGNGKVDWFDYEPGKDSKK